MATTPANKAPAKKAAPPARTRAGAATRTAAAPAAVVEEEAVAVAAARPPRTRPSPDRPAAKAAAALRGGDPEETAQAPEPTALPEIEVPDDAPADPDPLRTVMLDFHNRKIEVKLPTEEQLTMYHRLSREFQDLARQDTEKIGMNEALRHLDRATRLVQSVMVHDYDRDWLEDQMLEGKIKLTACTELLKEAFKQLHDANLAEPNNRQERRKDRSKARLADA